MKPLLHDTFLSDQAGLAEFLRQECEDNSAQKNRLRKNLQRAIQEELTPRQREMLLMLYSQNCSPTEISRTLGVAPSTVSRTLARAKKRLERALKYSF